ncbi:hypothetical protein GmHk_02G005044 [Glycine max]|nr:uncharacterized protein LOC113000680 [Glycine max]KAH1262414.1 hypothetical protein GmHk_02G005044 [Glycine max]|eukprot:XP_025983051.1 uncharacterized protein LOC113000680 [Glycine max]
MAGPKTYWCHECDMSMSLTLPPSPLLYPPCHTHFLKLMDSLTLSQNDIESSLFDVVFQDALLLLNPLPQNPAPSPPSTSPPPSSPPSTPAVSSFTASSAKTKLPPLPKPNNYPANTYTTPMARTPCLVTEEDFYGLRITLNHITSRHALIEENENRSPQIGKTPGESRVQRERFASMKASMDFRISSLLDKIYNSKILVN